MRWEDWRFPGRPACIHFLRLRLEVPGMSQDCQTFHWPPAGTEETFILLRTPPKWPRFSQQSSAIFPPLPLGEDIGLFCPSSLPSSLLHLNPSSFGSTVSCWLKSSPEDIVRDSGAVHMLQGFLEFLHGGALLEHSPRMESYEESPGYSWENPKKPSQESWDLNFFKNKELLLDDTCMHIPSQV